MTEFQKRGLPHCHLLIILEKYKIKTKEDIDTIVSAKIPDRKKYHNLFKKVCDFMIHNPCKDLKNAVCHKNSSNKCKAKFPKNYSNETIINDDGYPTYLRRNTIKSQLKIKKSEMNMSCHIISIYYLNMIATLMWKFALLLNL